MVVYTDQPVECSGVTSPESLELLHGPSDEVVVDAPCQEAQLGAVEDSVSGRELARCQVTRRLGPDQAIVVASRSAPAWDPQMA